MHPPFLLHRIGVVMEPELGNPMELEGVLNPASARDRNGHLYLFPRLVARGNYSCIGIAKVQFDAAGNACGVERLGVALEPTAAYELNARGGGWSFRPPSINAVISGNRIALISITAWPITASGWRVCNCQRRFLR